MNMHDLKIGSVYKYTDKYGTFTFKIIRLIYDIHATIGDVRIIAATDYYADNILEGDILHDWYFHTHELYEEVFLEAVKDIYDTLDSMLKNTCTL